MKASQLKFSAEFMAQISGYTAKICSHPVASVATECVAVPQAVVIVANFHRHVLGTGALLE